MLPYAAIDYYADTLPHYAITPYDASAGGYYG